MSLRWSGACRSALVWWLCSVIVLGQVGCGGGAPGQTSAVPSSSVAEVSSTYNENAARLSSMLDAIRWPVQVRGARTAGTRGVVDVAGGLVDLVLSIVDSEQIDSIQATVEETQRRLQDLGSQVTGLQTALNSLAARLDIQMTTLISAVVTQNVNVSLQKIESTYDDGTANSFAYYLNKRTRLTALERSNLVYFVSNVLDNWHISNHVNTIHGGIVAPPEGEGLPILDAYVDQLVARLASRPERTSEDVYTSYLLLEQYFLKLLTHQAKGAVMVANCWNYREAVNPVGGACGPSATAFLQGFEAKVQDEIGAFRKATARLLIKTSLLVDRPSYESDFARFVAQGGPLVSAPDGVRQVLARHEYFGQLLSEQKVFGARLFIVATEDTEVNLGGLRARPAGATAWREAQGTDTFDVSGPAYIRWLDDSRFTTSTTWKCYEAAFSVADGEATTWEFEHRLPQEAAGRLVATAPVALRDPFFIEGAGSESVLYGMAAVSWRWGPQGFTPGGGKWTNRCSFTGYGPSEGQKFYGRSPSNPAMLTEPTAETANFGADGFRYDASRPLSLEIDMWPPLGRYLTSTLDLRFTRDFTYVGSSAVDCELVAVQDGAWITKNGFWGAETCNLRVDSTWQNRSDGTTTNLLDPIYLEGWGGYHEQRRPAEVRSTDLALRPGQSFRVEHGIRFQTQGTNTPQWWTASNAFKTAQLLVRPR